MVYSMEQIQALVAPIARKYGLRAVYLFGSYARGTAREDSDIDLLIDTSGTEIKSLLGLSAVCCELEEALDKPVDLITMSFLEQLAQMPSEQHFKANVVKERVSIYTAV